MRFFAPSFSALTLTAALLAGAALPGAAATLAVPSRAYPTIQSAVRAAKPGDTVLVSAKPGGGVYNEAVTITTPGVVLQGQGNPVIDGTGLGKPSPVPSFPPVTIYPNGIEIRASHVAVRGLTVQNNGDSPYNGPSGISTGYVTPDGQTDVAFSDIEISGVTLKNNFTGITIMGLSGPSVQAGGTPKALKGYRVLGNVISGSAGDGALITGVSEALVAGNQFLGCGNVGLVTQGSGILVTGNEASGSGYGMALNAAISNPAVSDPKAPSPSAIAGNYLHDNLYVGMAVTGTQAVTGNLLLRNAATGLSLFSADYSTVSGNLISGTILSQFGSGGTGLYVNSGTNFLTFAPGGHLKITGNVITGSAGDGIFLDAGVGSTVSGNSVSGSGGIGIHLSAAPQPGDAPNVVTQNTALRSAIFDARDDASAPDDVTYNGNTYYGNSTATVNLWTRNRFGTTDPVGLSK